MALAFDDGGNAGVIGIDHFKVTQLLALGELFGLLADLFIMTYSRGEFLAESLAWGLTEHGCLLKVGLSLLTQGWHVFAQIEKLLFRLANQLDENFAFTTATAKAAHDFAKTLLQVFSLGL